jgi:hypothetical protein
MKNTKSTGVFLPLTHNEIKRLEAVAINRRESLDCWLLTTILGVLEVDEDEAQFEKQEAKTGRQFLRVSKKKMPRKSHAVEDGGSCKVEFSNKDANRLYRAAKFSGIDPEEFVRRAVMSFVEDDEDEMTPADLKRMNRSDDPIRLGQISVGRENSNWEAREALPPAPDWQTLKN